MASDKQRFGEAVEHWNELHQSRKFSVAPFAGYVAVVCSYFTDIVGAPTGSPRNIAEVESFAAELKALAEKITHNGGKPLPLADADQDTMREILAEPAISDVITIGHGSLSYLYLVDKDAPKQSLRFTELTKKDFPVNDKFDWFDAAMATTHLKTGLFLQRHCGHAVSDLSVPLGTFTVADVQKVYAPTLLAFDPNGIEDESENDKIDSVYDGFGDIPISYETIKQLLPRDFGE